MKLIFLFGSFILFWLLLSGYYIPLLLSLGVASSLLACGWYLSIRPTSQGNKINWWRFTTYLCWLLLEMIKANIVVAWAILTRANHEDDSFVEDVGSLPEMLQVIYANSITLTPGTISTELKDGMLTIHYLFPACSESIKNSVLRRKIENLSSNIIRSEDG